MNLDDQMDRCDLLYCKRRDFLPFKCSLCEKQYCLDHKELKDHECPFQFAEKKAVVCQKCQTTIQYLSTQFEFDVMSRHKCQEQPKSIKKCLVCKIKLNEVNIFHCPNCNNDVCLKHRMPDNHKCANNQKFCIIM